MIRQLTHLAVVAVSLAAGLATPAHARDDFMDKIIAENGLQGCKRHGFTTAWTCTGKTGSTGANAAYQPPSSDQEEDRAVNYGRPHNHDHDDDESDHRRRKHWENPRNHWKNDQPNR